MLTYLPKYEQYALFVPTGIFLTAITVSGHKLLESLSLKKTFAVTMRITEATFLLRIISLVQDFV
jgi:hypothetical protein